MPALRFILADDDSNGWVKAIPAIIIVSVWVVGIVSSWVKKAGANAQGAAPPVPRAMPPQKSARASALVVRGGIRPRPLGAQAATQNRLAPAKAARPVARPGALSVARTKAMFAQQQADLIRGMLAGSAAPAQKRREPALPKRQTVLSEVAPAPKDPPPMPRATESPRVDARALSKRMQPALLRYQYILTEVLRPPVALRTEEDDY
jgi:hypothetical protein